MPNIHPPRRNPFKQYWESLTGAREAATRAKIPKAKKEMDEAYRLHQEAEKMERQSHKQRKDAVAEYDKLYESSSLENWNRQNVKLQEEIDRLTERNLEAGLDAAERGTILLGKGNELSRLNIMAKGNRGVKRKARVFTAGALTGPPLAYYSVKGPDKEKKAGLNPFKRYWGALRGTTEKEIRVKIPQARTELEDAYRQHSKVNDSFKAAKKRMKSAQDELLEGSSDQKVQAFKEAHMEYSAARREYIASSKAGAEKHTAWMTLDRKADRARKSKIAIRGVTGVAVPAAALYSQHEDLVWGKGNRKTKRDSYYGLKKTAKLRSIFERTLPNISGANLRKARTGLENWNRQNEDVLNKLTLANREYRTALHKYKGFPGSRPSMGRQSVLQRDIEKYEKKLEMDKIYTFPEERIGFQRRINKLKKEDASLQEGLEEKRDAILRTAGEHSTLEHNKEPIQKAFEEALKKTWGRRGAAIGVGGTAATTFGVSKAMYGGKEKKAAMNLTNLRRLALARRAYRSVARPVQRTYRNIKGTNLTEAKLDHEFAFQDHRADQNRLARTQTQLRELQERWKGGAYTMPNAGYQYSLESALKGETLKLTGDPLKDLRTSERMHDLKTALKERNDEYWNLSTAIMDTETALKASRVARNEAFSNMENVFNETMKQRIIAAGGSMALLGAAVPIVAKHTVYGDQEKVAFRARVAKAFERVLPNLSGARVRRETVKFNKTNMEYLKKEKELDKIRERLDETRFDYFRDTGHGPGHMEIRADLAKWRTKLRNAESAYDRSSPAQQKLMRENQYDDLNKAPKMVKNYETWLKQREHAMERGEAESGWAADDLKELGKARNLDSADLSKAQKDMWQRRGLAGGVGLSALGVAGAKGLDKMMYGGDMKKKAFKQPSWKQLLSKRFPNLSGLNVEKARDVVKKEVSKTRDLQVQLQRRQEMLENEAWTHKRTPPDQRAPVLAKMENLEKEVKKLTVQVRGRTWSKFNERMATKGNISGKKTPMGDEHRAHQGLNEAIASMERKRGLAKGVAGGSALTALGIGVANQVSKKNSQGTSMKKRAGVKPLLMMSRPELYMERRKLQNKYFDIGAGTAAAGAVSFGVPTALSLGAIARKVRSPKVSGLLRRSKVPASLVAGMVGALMLPDIRRNNVLNDLTYIDSKLRTTTSSALRRRAKKG